MTVEAIASEAGGTVVEVGISGPPGDSLVLSGTSDTAITIGLGSKTFGTQSGKSFHKGTWVSIVSRANSTNRMHGVITEYDEGDLTVDVQRTNGSGLFDDWDIHVTGALGAAGPAGPTNNVFYTLEDLSDAEVDESIEAVFVLGYQEVGVGGGLYVKRPTEPTHTIKVQSQDGAWWELKDDNGTVYVTQFGLVPHSYTSANIQSLEGTLTDSYAAYNAMQDYLAAISTGTHTPDASTGRRSSPRVFWPMGLYYFSETIEIKDLVQQWEGLGNSSHSGPGQSTFLIFARGKHGIRQHLHTTTGVPPVFESGSGIGYTSQGFSMSGIGVRSFGGGAGTTDGIQVRVPCVIRDSAFMNFGRDGINVHAQAGGADPALSGNANLVRIYNVLASNNGRCGLFLEGADANACLIEGVSANANGKYGIWDSSFLGNSLNGCHVDRNGVINSAGQTFSGEANTVPATVRWPNIVQPNMMHRWTVMHGKEVQASTTEPGTDPTVWQFVITQPISAAQAAEELLEPGKFEELYAPSFIPLWSNGQTYQHGGGYMVEGGSQHSVLVGCYGEGGSTANIFGNQVIVIGGTLGGPVQYVNATPNARIISSSGYLQNTGGFKARQFDVNGRIKEVAIGGNFISTHGDILSCSDSISAPAGFNWKLSNTTGELTFNYGTDPTTFYIAGPNATTTHGRASPVTNGMHIRFLWVGTLGFGRQITNAAAVPSSGEWARGDIIFRQSPSASTTSALNKMGWVCITSGVAGNSPGAVFAEFGVIDSVVAPGVPTNVGTSSSGGTVTITWTNPNSANFHAARVYRAEGGAAVFADAVQVAGPFFGAANQAMSTTNVADASSPFSGTFRYWVTSENSSGVTSTAAGPSTITL